MSLFGLTQASIKAAPNSNPPCQIASTKNPLHDPLLVDLANAFAALDTQLLTIIQDACEEAPRRNPVAEAEESALRELGPVNNLQTQFEAIRAGRGVGFSANYLEERCLLEFWKRAYELLVWRFEFGFSTEEEEKKKGVLEDTRGVFEKLEGEAEPLFEIIPEVVRRGLLKGEAMEVVRLRMVSLDTMFDMFHRRTGSERRLKTWWVLGILLVGFRTDAGCTLGLIFKQPSNLQCQRVT